MIAAADEKLNVLGTSRCEQQKACSGDWIESCCLQSIDYMPPKSMPRFNFEHRMSEVRFTSLLTRGKNGPSSSYAGK